MESKRVIGAAFAAGLWVLLAWTRPAVAATGTEAGFVSLFNGHDLTGWMGAKYEVENGELICPAHGGGILLTTREYDNFVLRFEFKLPHGGNNGIGIRTPAAGDPAYVGMEIQILDDSAPQYAHLRPAQYHGSIYDVVPARRGALKPVGEWNEEEIVADGRHIRVTVNGKVTMDANLDDVKNEATLKRHPGLQRTGGYIGLLGHGDRVEFRHLRIKELPPPAGTVNWVRLFDGEDLTGWKGLVGNPVTRRGMTPDQLAEARRKADERMRAHWHAEDGVLVFDGHGDNLCTAKDYGDFELLVDWKILPKGDSGIYLRGSPQVQIWDNPIGSGGLYNNQKNPSGPLQVADKPVGEWNHFDIRMIGDKVTVFLNGVLVVNQITLENYWERDKPIYPTGQIELQNHGNTLYFRNIFIRELRRP